MAEGTTPSRKRAFDVAFKLKVVEAAECTNNTVAARKFSIDQANVDYWRKQKHAPNYIRKKLSSRWWQEGKTSRYRRVASLLDTGTEVNKLPCHQRGYSTKGPRAPSGG